MAEEYIYVRQSTDQPAKLQHFHDLRYKYDKDFSVLEIIDSCDKRVASFHVIPEKCYMLQRRNQSALQLHEVTPPQFCLDEILWLFGFGRKQHCDSMKSFTQACENYRTKYPKSQLDVKEYCHYGVWLWYATALKEKAVDSSNPSRTYFYQSPVAFFYEIPANSAWAFSGQQAQYEIVHELNRVMYFKYPLQYVINVFRGATMSYPTETRNFFRNELGIKNDDVYYADIDTRWF